MLKSWVYGPVVWVLWRSGKSLGRDMITTVTTRHTFQLMILLLYWDSSTRELLAPTGSPLRNVASEVQNIGKPPNHDKARVAQTAGSAICYMLYIAINILDTAVY